LRQLDGKGASGDESAYQTSNSLSLKLIELLNLVREVQKVLKTSLRSNGAHLGRFARLSNDGNVVCVKNSHSPFSNSSDRMPLNKCNAKAMRSFLNNELAMELYTIL
jgi:hypothetical protein